MFPEQTLFILGAGASKEVNLPIGTELAETIATQLDIRFSVQNELISGDSTIVRALRAIDPRAINDYRHAGIKIRDGVRLATSIDTFIDTHRHDEKIAVCGKLAIALSIRRAEKASLLAERVDGNEPLLRHDRLRDTWFPKFFKILTDGISHSDLDSLFDRITIINFNYDRCVEHFLVQAIRMQYAVDRQRACEVVMRLKIIHPYGTIGPLPWQHRDGVAFGQDIDDASELVRLSKGIRTFTEKIEEGDALREIRQLVARAKMVVFLGFAYYPQNLALLTPDGPGASGDVRVFATGFGVSYSDCQIVQLNVVRMLAPVSRLDQVPAVRDGFTCSQLFDEYARTFSAFD